MKSKKNATCQKEFCYDKNQKFKFKLYKKIRDHCHYTGKFKGAAHKKEHDDNDKTITCKIKIIDTCRFMQSKLSNLVDNLSEINNKDCKTCMERKKYQIRI